ncbi:nuclear transport factor 2 family protein [Celerinatantimonas diazotrophica]|uniref:DUF4440 domain-containing protein n=1 Tax=Celerinatantimonas diazotrophica TaxID=412034 RepID=A0A4R1K4Q5_9GAMM|nr:DUF4440 domain-containing protein [Celerinatantimonas diazotrophica]TCK57999.1 hypothetical protein EV690_1704 [Celerinatantimonas diazotrophica]CAG9297932.1 hypothetical protein CEDIAZO_03124 [Celerinatantimonas diazotrophica]
MEVLIEQEIALHRYEIRQDLNEVARLLHSSFKEVGRSGRSFDYSSILGMMQSEEPSNGHIHSQDFECILLEPSVQLLLYKSAWVSEAGEVSAFTKRSSIWVFTGQGWQMKYHQGTPCEKFELL